MVTDACKSWGHGPSSDLNGKLEKSTTPFWQVCRGESEIALWVMYLLGRRELGGGNTFKVHDAFKLEYSSKT